MSVVSRSYLVNSVDNFYHIPTSNSFSPSSFVVGENSSGSRLVFSAPYDGVVITSELLGNFSSTFVAGTAVAATLNTNFIATVNQSKTYINGLLFGEETYSPAVSAYDLFHSTSDATTNLLQKIYAGNDTFVSTTISSNAPDDKVNGYAGNDTFYGFGDGGSDLFDGGTGIDTAVYRGVRTNYAISKAEGFWNPVTDRADLSGDRVVDRTGLDGTDQLTNVERLAFADGTLALDIAPGQNAGQAYRLYQAAFARTPDMPGVKYHLNDMETNGLTLWNIASNFLASPEFASKYGSNPTDTQYINALYRNVLNRDPGGTEVDWYQNHLILKPWIGKQPSLVFQKAQRTLP